MAIIGHGGLVQVHVKVNQTHVNRIVTNLKKVTSRRLLDLVDLTDEEVDLQGEFLSRFPESEGTNRRTNAQKAFYAKLGLTHLIQGWRLKYNKKQYGYELSITHTKARIKKVAELLEHLDKGTRQSTWWTEKWISFFDYRSGEKQARAFPEGTLMLHQETKAHDYVNPTLKYAAQVIAPRIRKKVLKEVDYAAKGKQSPGAILKKFNKEFNRVSR